MNPVLLVTGGSRGIGAATALLAAERGYAVAVNYAHNSLAADEVVRQIRASGGQAMAVQADVGVEAQVVAMFKRIDAKLGPLTALVNNAGVVDVASRVDEVTTDRLRRLFDINVLGSFLCAREAILRMSTRHGGSGRQHCERLQRGGSAGWRRPVCGLCGHQRGHGHLHHRVGAGSGERGYSCQRGAPRHH